MPRHSRQPDVATLQTWVSNGGSLIVTGDSGSLLGESGNFAATNTLGLSPLTGGSRVSTERQPSRPISLARAWFRTIAPIWAILITMLPPRPGPRSWPLLQLPFSNAYAVVNAQSVLASSNAPATVGLTLYQGTSKPRTFVDLNNFNVASSSPYLVTPVPAIEVDLAVPGWLTNGLTATAAIVSPDGPLSVASLSLSGNPGLLCNCRLSLII